MSVPVLFSGGQWPVHYLAAAALAALLTVLALVLALRRRRVVAAGAERALPEAPTARDDTVAQAVLPDTAGHLSALGKAGSISATPAPGVPANAPTLHPEKGPRAAEVPENPVLPPGEVKIRSLCCNQKMRNQSEKFGRQRRCPKCGAEPFRYRIEPAA